MKNISRRFCYDDEFFTDKIPAAAVLARPALEEDIPVFIKRDLFSAEECRLIADQFLAAGPSDQPGANAEADGVVRKAFSFDLAGEAKVIYEAALASMRTSLERFYGVSLAGSAGAHGLGYTPGCKYDLHADNCDPQLDESGNLQGFRHVMPDRHLSTLVFLTDSVEEMDGPYQHIGGNLSFRFLVDEMSEPLLIEPARGMFVAFPSDPVFSHEVHEVHAVSTEFRLAIVDWHACNTRVIIQNT